MTKRFLLQKIKRSIPISNDVIHPNFNKYYLNRYKFNQSSRSPNNIHTPINEKENRQFFATLKRDSQRIKSVRSTMKARARAHAHTCTHPPCFRFDIGPRARNSREYQRKLLLARDAQQIRETSRCYAFPFCRIPAFRNFPRSRPPSLPLPQLIESNQRFLDPSARRADAYRCLRRGQLRGNFAHREIHGAAVYTRFSVFPIHDSHGHADGWRRVSRRFLRRGSVNACV